MTDQQLAEELFSRAFGPDTALEMPANWPNAVGRIRAGEAVTDKPIATPAAWHVALLIKPKSDEPKAGVPDAVQKNLAWALEALIRELACPQAA